MLVCVTGGSGFLGSWVTKYCLDQGWSVNVTTRTVEKAAFLQQLDGAKERLKLFTGCDLLKEGSFDEAITGCQVVFHTASPFFMYSKDEGVQALLEPAILGTKNVLNSCNKLGVSKVVLTSSTAAVYMNYGTKTADHVFSEADWSDEKLLEDNKNYYCLSKTRAEKVAWEISKQEGCTFKLAVMNPCLIFGPMLKGQPHLNTSCNAVLKFYSGEMKTIPNQCTHIVDVRDVARAHLVPILAGEDWSGWGNRFLLVGGCPKFEQVANYLRTLDEIPEDMRKTIPTTVDETIPKHVAGAPPPHITKFNLENATKETTKGGLGIKFFNTEEMVLETVKTLAENGFTSVDQYTLDKI